MDTFRTQAIFVIVLLLTATWLRLVAADERPGFLPENLSVAVNGTFIHSAVRPGSRAYSPDGSHWCRYRLGRVGDEYRELLDFRLYRQEQMLYRLERAPGSDLYISNSGLAAFMDMSRHDRGQLTIHFYSAQGQCLSTRTFRGAFLFGFSPQGDRFAVCTTQSLQVIDPVNGETIDFEKGLQFDISTDGQLVAVAAPGRVMIYRAGQMIREIRTAPDCVRAVSISEDDRNLALVDKKHLWVYDIQDGHPVFGDTLRGECSFRDLLFHGDVIITGVHRRGSGVSAGILQAYDLNGRVLLKWEGSENRYRVNETPEAMKGNGTGHDPIPWPFFPWDQMHTVWNYYEQHMGGYGTEWSYLHQGLDIIVPIGEPVFAVADGIVKCVLTLGGDFYWRTAISREQTADRSTGWLYAHLIPQSIQFDVGDTVRTYDYLGDIIQWAEDWGHIHFVEIQDSGLVWRYDDDEWGITYNPLLSLQPNTDLIPPIIENVFGDSKLAFCRNETSLYIDADSLHGDVDIIVKVKDYVGDSPWEQPAFELYYWLKRRPGGETVFPRTLGQILNHPYQFYESDHYEPYATLLYKRDERLVPSSWMEQQRRFYHILTNNDGDSLALLSEKALAFPTAAYPDGPYRFYVEARDEYGNATVDSMDVVFRNDQVDVESVPQTRPAGFSLTQNYPNPFNPQTTIGYAITADVAVKLQVYDILGREVATLVNGVQPAGAHQVVFRADGLASGIYVCRIQVAGLCESRKMLLLK